MLIKGYLSTMIANVDTSIDDQVWIKMKFVPRMLLGFCYVPSTYLLYFSHASFRAIQEKVKMANMSNVYFIIGDINACFRSMVRELPVQAQVPDSEGYSYPIIPDDVRAPNDNAYVLSTICSCK